MAVFSQKLDLTTQKQFEIVDVTAKVLEAVKQSKIKNGLVSIFSPHTTAAIRINHFEPLLLQDIMKLMYRLAPLETNYAHDFFEIRTEVQANERSNGHAHVKAFLLGSSQTVPVVNQKMLLGFRQSIFFVEMDGPRERDFIVTVIGD
jgi:secondary thiamine-phosphate synthase enzyme